MFEEYEVHDTVTFENNKGHAIATYVEEVSDTHMVLIDNDGQDYLVEAEDGFSVLYHSK